MTQTELGEKILKRVFGDSVSLDAETFIREYLSDIRLPEKVKDSLTGKSTWTSTPGLDAYVDQKTVIEFGAKHDWMYPKQGIKNLDELTELIKRSDFMEAGRIFDAQDVHESDDVGRSHHVYRSQNVLNSSNIVACNWIWDAEYLMGCMRSGASTFCIGLVEANNCSDSYRVYNARNIVKSMFIKNSHDLYECLFCAHLQHKKFCIANMQFSEAEYHRLKKQIIRWIFTG